MVQRDGIIIYKAGQARCLDTQQKGVGQNLFELRCLSNLHQTYSGLHNFDTIIRIIDGYRPFKVVSYCNEMHASTIVKIIFSLKTRKYRCHIHRAVIIDEPRNIISTIILRFYLIESFNL